MMKTLILLRIGDGIFHESKYLIASIPTGLDIVYCCSSWLIYFLYLYLPLGLALLILVIWMRLLGYKKFLILSGYLIFTGYFLCTSQLDHFIKAMLLLSSFVYIMLVLGKDDSKENSMSYYFEKLGRIVLGFEKPIPGFFSKIAIVLSTIYMFRMEVRHCLLIDTTDFYLFPFISISLFIPVMVLSRVMFKTIVNFEMICLYKVNLFFFYLFLAELSNINNYKFKGSDLSNFTIFIFMFLPTVDALFQVACFAGIMLDSAGILRCEWLVDGSYITSHFSEDGCRVAYVNKPSDHLSKIYGAYSMDEPSLVNTTINPQSYMDASYRILRGGEYIVEGEVESRRHSWDGSHVRKITGMTNLGNKVDQIITRWPESARWHFPYERRSNLCIPNETFGWLSISSETLHRTSSHDKVISKELFPGGLFIYEKVTTSDNGYYKKEHVIIDYPGSEHENPHYSNILTHTFYPRTLGGRLSTFRFSLPRSSSDPARLI